MQPLEVTSLEWHLIELLHARHVGDVTIVNDNTDNPIYIIDMWSYTLEELLDILEKEGCP